MRRTDINSAIKWAEELAKEHHITLPCFANYAPDKAIFSEPHRANMKATMLGWDVTDFGTGDFSKVGAVLFTVRNGSVYDSKIGTPYAEKYIFLKDGNEQEIPLHYHVQKTEDIINRAGGVFCCQLAIQDENGRPDAEIEVDGNVSIPNAINMKNAGANIFVLGTAALFGHGPLDEGVERFRKEVNL